MSRTNKAFRNSAWINFWGNEYFLPRLPTFLATHYIPICPLCTSLILVPVLALNESHVRSSKAMIENWMRILKIDILQNQTKLRVGNFLRKTWEGLEGRIRAFGFAFEPLSFKILKSKRILSKIKDNKLAEEILQRRRKNRTTFLRQIISELLVCLSRRKKMPEEIANILKRLRFYNQWEKILKLIEIL